MAKKGFLQEFKSFISRGNVVDMAVGVIIGAAFQGIINSLVSDIVMPTFTMITGGAGFENWFVSLDGSTYASLADAKAAGASTLNYGVFISAIIQFLIMALTIFTAIKVVNKLREKTKEVMGIEDKEPPVPTTKECIYCKSEIAIDATRCPHCTSVLDVEPNAE